MENKVSSTEVRMLSNLELLLQLTSSPEWAARIAQEVEAIQELEPGTSAEDAARYAQCELLHDLIDCAKGKERAIRMGLEK